jgi:excisionase family DNA binding protein
MMPRDAVKVDRLLDLDAACERLGGIARSTLYALVAENSFPLCKLGPRLSRVRESDLEAFIARIPEGRSPSPNPRAGIKQ